MGRTMVGDARACKRAAHGKVIGPVIPYGLPASTHWAADKVGCGRQTCVVRSCV
jgi:hypothetical protein